MTRDTTTSNSYEGMAMNRNWMQWTVWALLMALFTGLTLAERWMDLAVALTLAAAFWYGIVPGPHSRRQ